MTAGDPRFRWILLVSVALNVLLAAVVGAAWWHHGGMRGHGIGGAVRLPRAEMLERVLPEADHAALHAAYARHRDDIRPRVGALWEARRDVREALDAEPFDPARAGRALAELRAREGEVAAAVHALLVDVSHNVSPEGRRAIAKLSTSHRGHGHGHRRGGEHGEAPPPDPTPTP